MKRILIVEDQPDIRELIRMTLEMEDFEVREAADGSQGWTLAQQWQPHLILLDVMMPGEMNGLAVCRQVRADARFKRTAVVMLSARGQAADLKEGRAAGADDYLVKPFSPRELLQVIKRLL